jgi:ribosome-binding ATPase YchF (GTP1/OBG family)
LGNKFLGGIREVDAVLYVLRSFVDPNVVGASDPLDDLATLELELVLADAASAETQLERRRKAAKFDKCLVPISKIALGLLQRRCPYRAGCPSTRSLRSSRSSSSPRSRCWSS